MVTTHMNGEAGALDKRGGLRYSIYYHFVRCTKYRRPVLVGEVAEYLKQLHEEIAKKRQIILREQVVNPDHVHLFITAHPKWSPSQLVKIFKGCKVPV